ncbi:MAG: hypothetical protein FJW53_01775 [Actinobacteria bacterium]|nr:hypothetical protein [Actinomycetota bacterium]
MNDETIETRDEMTGEHPSVSRRGLLRHGGAAALAGVVLAACADSAPQSVARLGEATEPQTLDEVSLTDVVLLRTAMSVEKLAHEALTSSTLATGANSTLMNDLAKGHENALLALRELVVARGGKPVDEANARLRANWADEALGLVGESTEPDTDGLMLAHALQTIVASTYQGFVPKTTAAELRAQMMELAAGASRRAAVIALQVAPGAKGFASTIGADGNPTFSALQSTFGTLASVQVPLGKKNEAGLKGSVTLETPSYNSYMW